MNFNVAGKNLMLSALSSSLTAALYTGSNFTTNEVTGGAYARKSVTYSAASGGSRDASALATFDVPAGTTITHAALFDGATRIAEGALVASEAYTEAGKYQLTDSDLILSDPL
jgi:hypothetical protein